MEEIFKEAEWICEKHGGVYELFRDKNDVLWYIPEAEELDDPIPEIWVKRIEECRRIIQHEDYPCIFDTINVGVECRIYDDGFYFDGKHYPMD